MARPHIEFIEAFAVEPEQLVAGPLAGAAQRLLSADPVAGDFTALLTCPAGWTGDVASPTRPAELFCIAGGCKHNPDRCEGIVVKLFREDPETKDWTWVSASCPGWLTAKAEVHPTVEEAFMLRGDILLGERGAMGPGSYFWRPGLVEHGPMFTRDGGLFFFRTKGGGLDTTWVDVPGWEQLIDDYVARRPFYGGRLD